jgi:hypothetical protein
MWQVSQAVKRNHQLMHKKHAKNKLVLLTIVQLILKS